MYYKMRRRLIYIKMNKFIQYQSESALIQLQFHVTLKFFIFTFHQYYILIYNEK